MEMTKRSIDRRVARTVAALHGALNSLIMKKPYEAISIRDICEVASVGRSTFYAHYTSKDDLKRRGFEPLRGRLRDCQREALGTLPDARRQSFAFSLAMFEHARDHRDHYRALVGGRGGTVSLGTIRKILSDLVRDELATAGSKDFTDTTARNVAVEFVVGAFMAVMTWWLDSGAKLPPERIDTVFRRLALNGIVSLYS